MTDEPGHVLPKQYEPLVEAYNLGYREALDDAADLMDEVGMEAAPSRWLRERAAKREL